MLIAKIIIAFVIAVVIFFGTLAAVDNFCGVRGDTAYCSPEGRPTFIFETGLVEIPTDALNVLIFVPAGLAFIATLTFMVKKKSEGEV